MEQRFTDVIQLIKQSRNNAIKAVNTELTICIGILASTLVIA